MSAKNEGERLLNAVRGQMAESGADDSPAVEPFTVNGVTILLRTLSAERLAAIAKWRGAEPGDMAGMYARLISASVVDETGNATLSIEGAANLPAGVAEQIVAEIITRNRFDKGAE